MDIAQTVFFCTMINLRSSILRIVCASFVGAIIGCIVLICSNHLVIKVLTANVFIPCVMIYILYRGKIFLSDMYAPYDDAIKPYINDYKINLISPAELNQGDFAKFHTDFGKVLEFIKCSADKGKMKKFKEENADFAFSAEAVIFLNKTTHSKLTLNKNEEEIVMCKALDDMCADAREEGRAEGLTAGHAAGHAEGLALGRTEVEHMSKLISLLLSKNRFEEARQAADNEAVRKELYARYSIV